MERPRALTAGVLVSSDLLRLRPWAGLLTESGLLFCKMGRWPSLVGRLNGVIFSHSRILRNVTIFFHLRAAHLDKCPEHSPHNSKLRVMVQVGN